MNWRETIFKVGLDAALIVPLLFLGVPWWCAFIIAHTLNFAFNGQLFAMFTHMGATNVPAQNFLDQTVKIADECRTKNYVGAAIAYGSLSRGCFKSTSDIDLRLIPAGGEWNWWKCVFWAFALRFRTFFRHYPLDLYVYEGHGVIKRMRSDELPIVLFERDNAMAIFYPKRVNLTQFIEIFKKKNLD